MIALKQGVPRSIPRINNMSSKKTIGIILAAAGIDRASAKE
jgi:hypothetical protein